MNNQDSNQEQEQAATQPAAPSLEDRNIRQRDIIRPERLAEVEVLLVGVGAIGRQLACQLAAVGVPKIRLVDYDTVGVENLAAQGFLEADLGRPKVDAVAEACRQINTGVQLATYCEKFKPEFITQMTRGEEDDTRFVVFSCVDSMDARKEIWETFSQHFPSDRLVLFVDARMGAEVARVLVVSRDDGKEYYPGTLFEADAALQQSCTAKTTIYCANIAAGMMVGQFTKWLRGMAIDQDTLFNIFASNIIHDSELLVATDD